MVSLRCCCCGVGFFNCAFAASRRCWVDVGSLFSIDRPILEDNPNGVQLRNSDGQLLYSQTITVNGVPQTTTVTSPTAPDGTANAPIIPESTFYREVFYGDSASPRVSVGVGVNWNSPFGPFRIDVSHVLRKQPGDDTKTFSFNVGTQF